jgi:hypothetical protein
MDHERSPCLSRGVGRALFVAHEGEHSMAKLNLLEYVEDLNVEYERKCSYLSFN